MADGSAGAKQQANENDLNPAVKCMWVDSPANLNDDWEEAEMVGWGTTGSQLTEATD